MSFTEEFESIRDAIYHKPWEDTGRLEACLSYALEALGEIGSYQGPCECGECEQHYAPSDEAKAAQAALRRMEMRVRLGDDVRPGSDMAMAWDYPEPRWRETLDDEDLT